MAEQPSAVIMHGAQGNEIPVLTTQLARLRIGKYTLKKGLRSAAHQP